MKNLIRFALRKPISIMIAVVALVFFSYTSIQKIKVDIFPEVELPSVYIAMPYGGLSPSYMDGFMANEFQKVLLFVGGVQNIDFKSVQGLTLMKISFYPGTDMAQAAGEISTSVSRAMGFLPEGAVPPMVVRFDGSSLPVGQLVFESDQHSINEIQTMVVSKIRPMFTQIPGITAPAPFGGSARSIVINIDPEAMQANGLSPEEITSALAQSSLPTPAGNVRIGDQNLMAPMNSIATDPEVFLQTPIKKINDRTISIGDVAQVEIGADITTGYALINGKRSVYLPIIKKADASTLTAVSNLKNSMHLLQEQLPEEVKVSYEFDQSKYIKQSLSNLVIEGILGALFTGLMIFLFLNDSRGALIVVLTIPISLLTAVSLLFLMGQTINIMTLSGLALSIGILVDEATVTIENIHQHFEKGKSKQRAILDALFEISIPKLLILLCILAVLTPSIIMTGIPKDMFMPLSMAVAFAMIVSFIASQTFVPIMANWLMKIKPHKTNTSGKKRNSFERFRIHYSIFLRKTGKRAYLLLLIYVTVSGIAVGILLNTVGTDVMPLSNSGDFQMRIEAPYGSRIEKTESYVQQIIEELKEELPENGIGITSAYVGPQPANSPINPIFLFTSASHEAVLQVSIDQSVYKASIEDLKEKVRIKIDEKFPELNINYEPMELTEKIMSQGGMTPIEIKVGAGQIKNAHAYAQKIEEKLNEVSYLRDVRIAEALEYPTLEINVDRRLAAHFGLTMKDVSRSLVTATSSTRFTHKNLWVDPQSGLVFQVQVQMPENLVSSEQFLRSIPLRKDSPRPVLEDVATLSLTTSPAQVNRQGPNRYVTIVANLHQKDLGTASKDVKSILNNLEEPPRGVKVWTEGMLNLLDDTLSSLLTGLGIAILVVFLMLYAYYQNFRVPLVVLSVLPAVVGGSLIALFVTGSTLNLQSYMGIIMALGVSVSNAILLLDQAEFNRRKLRLNPNNSSKLAAVTRLRPVLMTAAAMLAGMLPMAIGIGQGSEQAAPLGRAVIGGIIASTFTILLIIPHLFSSIMTKAKVDSPSLDPDDENSIYFK
jgi:multidrug efflux pump subunit AcrB